MSNPNLNYQSGFGNQFASEAVEGALPIGRNSPQRVAHGLYAELLSGTAFTAPRAENLRTWMYRRQPSVVIGAYQPLPQPYLKTGAKDGVATPPDPLRWHPVDVPEQETDFVQGLRTVVVNGDPDAQTGMAAHLYLANRSMTDSAFVNADGEMLLVPQQGTLTITTELGMLEVAPGEIALLPRGMAFKVAVDGPSRGYVCENYGAHFRLPELGPIGSNGLANARDFLAPVAAHEKEGTPYRLIKKYNGALWSAPAKSSPFNVVAWHGNLVPFKYDTKHFMTIGSISFDHPDPSIFTVLTSPSDTAGTANCDFVIFPPRWMVAEDTFRPPWYHRNVMSEFMGLVQGQYDAKPEGFKPGGMSLHNCMVPHGPDAEAFDAASSAALAPRKLDDTLAFMFESRWRFHATEFALNGGALDSGYASCWANLKDNFKEQA
ncbi:homogentisate 1,2-dioxygenase [Noviherbaspirillum cavernae]|uniref:Homogentisate 1,2-dioxygenase n=1 Tax=Noviherbaspirillum cavernae TaxID=2320862 RepID=A0A418WZ59_9BURK|nr:homogentisate 1,2-dioxygenase [Noviherbaspirillum cavernae]RJG05506.1 homogentisate 1,2-dioxygenase [Noviherbaspirillum cavernae]